MNGIPTSCLLDSGSTLTLIHPDIYSQISSEQRPALAGNPIKLRMADGGLIESLGRIQIEIAIEGKSVGHSVVVAEVESPVILSSWVMTSLRSMIVPWTLEIVTYPLVAIIPLPEIKPPGRNYPSYSW